MRSLIMPTVLLLLFASGTTVVAQERRDGPIARSPRVSAKSLVQRASVASFAGRVALATARVCTGTIMDTATGHIATTRPMAIAPTTDIIARMGMALATAIALIIATGSKRSDPSSCRSAFHESRSSCSR